MLKIGLIGAGFMGGMHAACYKALAEKDVTVVAVADLDTAKANAAAQTFGADIYSTGYELIEKADVDAIDICLPTYLHTKHAIAAMKKGKAVFIEKPVCLNADEVELLLKAQRETQVQVMAGQCIRSWPEYRWLKRTLDSGIYGGIRSGVFHRVSPKPAWAWDNWLHKTECSGSVALDLHIHDSDYIRYLLGEPGLVSSDVMRDSDGVIQQIFTNYRFGETLITAEGGWDYPADFPFSMSFRIMFEKATAVFDSATIPLTVYPNTGGEIVPEIDIVNHENDIGGNISSLSGYYNELKYFTERLNNNQPIELATLKDAARSVELVLKEIAIVGGVRRQGGNR